MHVDDERIQRFMDGELDSAARDRVERHVGVCAACRTLLDRALEEQAEVDRRLDHLEPAPLTLQAEGVIRAAGRAERRRWLGRAAAVILALGFAGAAWAAPGSPIPRWIRSLLPGAPADTAAVPESSGAGESGGGILASAGALLVTVPGGPEGASGTLRILLTDDSLVSIRALEGPVSFTDRGGRIEVTPAAAAVRVEMRVPRGAGQVSVEVGGRPVFGIVGGRVELAPGSDAEGPWVVRLEDPGG